MSAHVFRTSSDPEWINCDWLERLIFYGLWTLSCRDGDTTLIEGLCIIYQIGLGDASIKVFSVDSAVLLCLLICRVVKLLSKYPRVQVHLNMCSEPVPSYVSLIDKCNVCSQNRFLASPGKENQILFVDQLKERNPNSPFCLWLDTGTVQH